MEQTFITAIEIKKVRHLHDIMIPLSEEKRKHLILTGKNGSGKTSVLEALVEDINFIFSDSYRSEQEVRELVDFWKTRYDELISGESKAIGEKLQCERNLMYVQEELNAWKTGAHVMVNRFNYDMKKKYIESNYILAYYKADRMFSVLEYSNIEKITLKNSYSFQEFPGKELTKYMVDLKATQAFSKNVEKRVSIENWFQRLEKILKIIFENDSLELLFNEETFQFSLKTDDREEFDFNTLSSGYSAVINIVADLLMRMEAQSKLRASFDMEGIVLIDEIETHLHLELQKKILPILTELFPNIQFIVSTHSPFILNSLENAVIYDLEKGTLVQNGMKNLPYEGIVEGYFGADRLSDELRNKFERYKVLVKKEELTDEEYAEVSELEFYLDEIPDFLASEVAAEYGRLKLEFSNRE